MESLARAVLHEVLAAGRGLHHTRLCDGGDDVSLWWVVGGPGGGGERERGKSEQREEGEEKSREIGRETGEGG